MAQNRLNMPISTRQIVNLRTDFQSGQHGFETGGIMPNTLARGKRILLLARVMMAVLLTTALNGSDHPAPIRLSTRDGFPFGIIGAKPRKPAPTILVFANSLDGTIGNHDFN